MDEPLSQRDTGSKRPRTTNEAAALNRQVRNRDIDNDLRALKQAVDDLRSANADLQECFKEAQKKSHDIAAQSYSQIATNQNAMNEYLHGSMSKSLAESRADMAAMQKMLEELKAQTEAREAGDAGQIQMSREMAEHQAEWTRALEEVGRRIDEHNHQIEAYNKRLEALDGRFAEMADKMSASGPDEQRRRDMQNEMMHGIRPSVPSGSLQMAELNQSMERTIAEFSDTMEDTLQKVASVAMNIEDLFAQKEAEAQKASGESGSQDEDESQEGTAMPAAKPDMRMNILLVLAVVAAIASAACLFLMLV